MVLIIAEKPSLARNIAAGIGEVKAKRDGYLECDGYLISWAFGHLFSLCDIEEYSPSPDGTGRWTMKNLPCFPKEFKFDLKKGADKKVDSGVLRQFKTIEALCNREDVDTIVNAGDADREGEIIVRTCVNKALHSRKKLMRLWLPDQTPQTVAKALSEMKEETEYQSLANEGYARTYIDWLYGVNLTRYATLKTGKLLRVGRVIIPIVKAIYDRDLSIRNFQPEKYYAVFSSAETNGEAVELLSKRKFTKDEREKAEELCRLYNATGAVVVAKKTKKDKLSAGKLYSLSKLQNVLGKKYKMSMAESLSIVQKLYEEGYLTYPRTNSEYLATAEKDKIRQILSNVKKTGYDVTFKDGKSIFDDSKIESHSALTPTYKIPDKNKLSEKEMQVYSTVFRRFVAVFCAEECIVEKSELTVSVGELETFSLKGTVILQKGWTKYDDREAKDKFLPNLNEGDKVEIDFKPQEKETSPPRHYTIETLNNYLKNPFRDEKAALATEEGVENDEEDYKAIFDGLELGTEATRTGIIDNARKSGYIQLKKDVYTILPDGEFLIESLSRMKINMDKYKTSELGKALKKVYRGDIEISDSVHLAENEIREVFNSNLDAPIEQDEETGCIGDVVGKCPLCEGEVRRTTFGYGCSNYKTNACRFSVREYICSRAISLSNMRLLLETGRTSKIKGFVSPKTKKTFDATLKLEGGEVKFDFSEDKREARPRNEGARPPELFASSRRYEVNPELPPDFFDK
ncbi:MAG: topoisomerase C-terminal repeat-containing protein [Clostridia bacterium]|nr:topoisomerase C-terminal repeat-containing protein [Clostridia bacterium]